MTTGSLNVSAKPARAAMTPVPMLDEEPDDVEELLTALLSGLRRSGSAFIPSDGLPFTLITHIAGKENLTNGLADPVVSIHTLCDRALGWSNAKKEAKATHRVMLALGRLIPAITLTSGRQASVDYVDVFESPVWVSFPNLAILEKVGRYRVGLSYVPV